MDKNNNCKKGLIYCATNIINNKKYIGVTTVSLKERKRLHERCINTRDHPFYLALREYGIDSFNWEVVEDNICEDFLYDKERYYIALYNTQGDGYNATNGGDGRYIYKEEDIKNIVNLYISGLSCNEIGEMYNVSYTTILRVLYRNNVQTRKDGNKYKGFDHDSFVNDYFNPSLSNKDLGEIYNVCHETVQRHAKRLGLPSRRDLEISLLQIEKRQKEIIFRKNKQTRKELIID